MKELETDTRISRRTMLGSLALVGLGSAVPTGVLGAGLPGSDWRSTLLDYLEKHARSDGGYGWEDQARSHLTPTFAVIGCYKALGLPTPRKAALAEYVRTHHPSQLKKLEQEHREFEYQQIQSLIWLGEDAGAFRQVVGSWTKPTVYFKQYEQQGNPIFGHEVTAFTCRRLLGMPLSGMERYVAYVDERRRSNGSFNGTLASDGSDGHVMNTWWGLLALQAMERLSEKRAETVKWIRSCQLPGGAFTWSPKPEFAGVDDAGYTWAAVRALHVLNSTPSSAEKCADYLRSLFNADGGASDRPGWRSNPLATYYALDALACLGALRGIPRTRKASAPVALPAGLKVFSAQIEAHGQGSPREAVELARALKIHLWGAKNASLEWRKRAQEIADERKVPVVFFCANEEYGTWVRISGLGTYSHTSDIMGPSGPDLGAPLANKGVVSWPEFRTRRLAPLQSASGRLVWQFGENEEIVRLFLDDSIERGGFAAISTFHFGNPDFTNSEPFLERWRGKIPFIALQDAHGPEPWWFADKTEGFRTLFLATEPTWEGWLKALEMNWTVPVRHDAVSGFQTWAHSGSPEVLEFVRSREKDWRWWDNPEVQRPMISLAALTPADVLEAGRPERGFALRARCAYDCAAHGQLKNPLAEVLALRLDGAEVAPELVTRKAPNGPALADRYHYVALENLTPGKHTAIAVARILKSGQEQSVTTEFFV